MPRVVLTSEKVAVAVALLSQGWTHERIGKFLGVERATISYAVTKRKTLLPGDADVFAANLSLKIVERTQAAAQRAIAVELRKMAAELENS